MATVYSPYVGDHIGANGLPVWVESGEEVTVDGSTLVRISASVVLDNRDQWFETRAEAWAKARELVLAAAERLATQAELLTDINRIGGLK